MFDRVLNMSLVIVYSIFLSCVLPYVSSGTKRTMQNHLLELNSAGLFLRIQVFQSTENVIPKHLEGLTKEKKFRILSPTLPPICICFTTALVQPPGPIHNVTEVHTMSYGSALMILAIFFVQYYAKDNVNQQIYYTNWHELQKPTEPSQYLLVESQHHYDDQNLFNVNSDDTRTRLLMSLWRIHC